MTDLSGIRASLLKLYPFTDEQLNKFEARLAFNNLKKREFLIKPGQISKCLTFINCGSLRFYTKADAGELTLNFFTENEWVADFESLLLQQPSKNYIDAFENSEVVSITLNDLHELMHIYPCFLKLNSLIAALTIPIAHITAISTKSPDMRYNELLLKHPNWINRFPQMQIASYLGITPETLSRVRARVL